jgi:hypothetical protein
MKKIILLVGLLLAVSVMLCAQVVPDAVYRQADEALAEEGVPKLSPLLRKSTASPWYPRLESYIMKKTRQLVIQNEMDRAKAVSLALIDNNLDNKEAVDLYQSIQETIARRENEDKKASDRETVNTFKQAATETKIKKDIAKTYKTATNTATGKKVYLDQDFNNTYRSYTWDFMLGLANIGYVQDSTGQNFKYGLSGSGSFFYHGEDFTIGADIEGGGMMLTLSGDDGLNWTGAGVASLSAHAISKYFFFRGGYAAFAYDSGSLEKSETVFTTPVAGLGFRDVHMGESGRFRMALDYYPGHLLEEDMIVAVGANIGLSFVLAKMQDFDFIFHTGFADNVFLYSDGLKNDAKLILAVGVGNYE